MKAFSARIVLLFISFLLVLLAVSCGPKRMIHGRILDAETRYPIEGAAVAIKWYSFTAGENAEKIETIDARQALSDDRGFFRIPEYPDKNYILGVYKNGYICWSSRDVFSNRATAATRKSYRQLRESRLRDGMEIRLVPLKKEHSRSLHAGFAVMVAGESTNHPDGPFHQAIASEFHRWRDNLRQNFQKQLGTK